MEAFALQITQSRHPISVEDKTRISKFNTQKILEIILKIVSEYNQEIPLSQTADNPVAPRGKAAQPSRDTRKTN